MTQTLAQLGWSARLQALWDAEADAGWIPARVVSVEYGHYEVREAWDAPPYFVRYAGAVPKGEAAPTVGDWLGLREEGDARWVEWLMPRHSRFLRRAAGRMTDAQTIVANVDRVFIVTAIGDDLNLRRIERYLVGVWSSGATPVVVVNKTDRGGAEAIVLIREIAGEVAVVATSAIGAGDISALEAQIVAGETVAFVGSSGVGKSSLINRLLGEARQDVQEVREADDKGRHTTTRRSLLRAPSGALVIDTPGMREVGLWEAEDGLDAAFSDIVPLSTQCRFRDCTHTSEPECALLDAVDEGELSEARLESYNRLVDELKTTREEAAALAARRARGRRRR